MKVPIICESLLSEYQSSVEQCSDERTCSTIILCLQAMNNLYNHEIAELMKLMQQQLLNISTVAFKSNNEMSLPAFILIILTFILVLVSILQFIIAYRDYKEKELLTTKRHIKQSIESYGNNVRRLESPRTQAYSAFIQDVLAEDEDEVYNVRACIAQATDGV